MKKVITIISLITLAGLIGGTLKAQTFNYVAQINSTISSIPYVFEGIIQSVEVFAGDDSGNKLPKSAAVWNGDIGYFYYGGQEAKGYSLAKIKVCKVYKGADVLKGGTVIDVLTKSFTLDNVYILRTGTGNSADTSIRFINVPPSHDEDHQFDFILPHVTYPKKIYFSDKIVPILSSNYVGKQFYSNFHTKFEMAYNVPVDVLQTDGTYKRIDAYCAIVPQVFNDQIQLQQFLNQINTINSHPTDYCDDSKNKTGSLNPVDSNFFNISAYPNPSFVNEFVKVKFNLPSEAMVTLLLTDISGKEIVNTEIGKLKNINYNLVIDNVERGLYFLQVRYGSGNQTLKIFKN